MKTKKIYGMTLKDWRILGDMLGAKQSEKPLSLAKYIEQKGLTTEERTSKRGTVLVKVYFSNGVEREYEKAHLDSTYFYGEERRGA